MSEVFVSYRRADSADATGRICDRLSSHFGPSFVFTDVKSIREGDDFPSAIRAAIESCDHVLVIIGPRWLDIADSAGQRRLDEPDDFVRLEVETALTGEKRIIPVLIGGAVMPEPEALPPSLRQLAFKNAVPVRPDPDFDNDIKRLIGALSPPRVPAPGDGDPPRTDSEAPRRRAARIAAVLAIVAASAGGLYASGLFERDPEPEPPSAGPGARPPSAGTENSVVPEILRDSVPYEPGFLGKISIPLPVVTDELSAGDILDGRVFNYIHYSLVMNERRSMPLYTAANIDRKQRVRVPRRRDEWLLDPRIPSDLQRGSGIYEGNDWDRGHLVQRSAIAWGDSARAVSAALSAFFYSNAVPQHRTFNQGIWYLLEEYVLERMHPESSRLSVFCGPINRQDDIEYRGVRIPRSFWKIVAVEDPSNSRNLKVYAYVMDQYSVDSTGRVQPIELQRRGGSFNPRKYQVPVSTIESLTPLKFGVLKDFDTDTES